MGQAKDIERTFSFKPLQRGYGIEREFWSENPIYLRFLSHPMLPGQSKETSCFQDSLHTDIQGILTEAFYWKLKLKCTDLCCCYFEQLYRNKTLEIGDCTFARPFDLR